MSTAMTFEKALEKLSGLVDKLEEGSLPLEKSLKLYEEGIALTAFCEKALDSARLKITELQEDIEARDFTASVGGGAVEVVVTGKKNIKSLTIKPEVVDPEDIEMLQDLVISAVNEAIANVEKVTEEEMTKVTGGVSLPGLF